MPVEADASDLAGGARSDLPPFAPRARLLHVLAVAAGNGLEFYDFLIYGAFAIYIGRAYFPSHNAATSLLLSLATFGIGFVTRPLGGFALGRLGDRMGRKPALMTSFGLMAVGTLALAVTPTYTRIGIAAPVIVIVGRLMQGFALGGEFGPSTAFLVEVAGDRRRGLLGAMQGASQGSAILAAAGVALALSFLLSASALEHWGWRLAFVVGLLIVPIGLAIRRSLPETAPTRSVEAQMESAAPIPWRLVALGLPLLASFAMLNQFGAYMITYALDTLRLPARSAFGLGVVQGLCVLVGAPTGGWLSDRFGRRLVMIPALSVSALLTLPAFGYLVAHPTPTVLYLVIAAMSVSLNLGSAPLIVSITESLPPGARCLALGALYAVALAVFGGATPLILAWLVHATANPLAPAFYRVGAAIIGLIAMANLRESAPAAAR